MTPVEEAVEVLYKVFGRYRAGTVSGCPCCTTPEASQRLKSKGLRDLSDDDGLGVYASAALYTWGTLNEFKHFLPRILELRARGELHTQLQVIYEKFVRSGPWLDVEKEALEHFTRVLFRNAFSGGGGDPLEVIDSAGRAEMDVVQLLDDALEVIEPARASGLARCVYHYFMDPPRFLWESCSRVLDDWFLSGRVCAYLWQVIEAHIDDPRADDWAGACDILEIRGGAPRGGAGGAVRQGAR